MDYPRCPREGDLIQHLGDLGLAKDLQELRGSRQGGACLKGRTPLALGVLGTLSLPNLLLHTCKFGNLGEVPARLWAGWFCM